MNQPVIKFVQTFRKCVEIFCTGGLTFTFETNGCEYTNGPDITGHVWHYNAYDPRTRTLSVHTDGPTFTCVCDIVRVTKTVTHDITHEFKIHPSAGFEQRWVGDDLEDLTKEVHDYRGTI